MSVIHTQGKPTPEVRLMAFPIICGVFLLVLFFRLWYFQVVLSSSLSERAALSQRNSPSVMAPRGRIFDREGNLIAGVEQELVVTAVPKEIHDHPEVLAKLSKMLGTTEKKLLTKVGKGLNPRLPTPIFVGAPIGVGTRILEDRDELPGIDVQTEPMRYDADTLDFTHILGNVWLPSENDIKRLSKEDIKPAEYVGKSGIEWYYEQQLMGEPGTQIIETDAKHRPVRVVGGDSPIPGSKLTLSVDETLQKIARQELVYPPGYKDRTLVGKPRKGAVVAVDPATGEILCMYSSPSYDLKDFEGGISKDDYEQLVGDPDKPFLNRAVDGVYPPGSTFKIVTSLAMQEAGILDPSTTVFCDGAYHITKKATIKCLEHHGRVSYVRALAESCNTYFCTMGVRVGPQALARAAKEMGLGEPAGLDMSCLNDKSIIPDPDFKHAKKLGRWYDGDTANTAIGQGFVRVSPLQMADLAAMVANRGVMFRPHLVHSMLAPGEREPEIVQPEVMHKIEMPDTFWNVLFEGLHGVLEPHGTASEWRIPGLDWAGKTGSSEFKVGGKTHSWFIAFAPLDHPKIAIAVVVEGEGLGADEHGAAPLARDIVKAYLFPKAPVAATNARSITPLDSSTLATSSGRPAPR